ncbi:probable WRKY transcription factor protein 1 [Leptopilina heterotoma]|uniref:probable WRKY transcription factor protein 1 n=1 Tax=Leptopilina heterotoma TaxID=63436 RepID=UPI001CA81BAE|nr:probable WRKY transcription factor protein 1 [Leptopilina heterotoma]
MRKDKLKAKTWERDRRQRMDTCYNTLGELLPPHQEGRKRNKVEILLHATKYIRDLHNRTDELFCTRGTAAYKEELSRLKKLITQLLSHIQLLSTLLKEAGIAVPAEPTLEKISPKLSDMKECIIKEQGKKPEKAKRRSPLKSSLKKNSPKSSVRKNFTANDKSAIENQENCINGIANKDDDSRKANTKSSASTVTISEQTDDAQVTSAPYTGKPIKRKAVKRAKKEKVEKKSSTANNGSITNLPPGALVFSGTKLMPVNPIILNNSQQNSMIVNQHSTSNPIILNNTQQNQMIVNQQHTNSIILNNAQQNQMIVVHPLQANHVQNSVISLQNQTSIQNIIPSTSKIPRISNLASVSTITGVQNLQKTITSDDIVNLKNIADNSKIGGHKAILPKSAFTKAITKTTMTYKVPIPAIHKEKVIIEKKEIETEERPKGKLSKSSRNQKEKNRENCVSDDKTSLKRGLNVTDGKNQETDVKKRKVTKSAVDNGKCSQVKITSIVEIPANCKTIGNIKQAIKHIERESEKKSSQDSLVPDDSQGDKNCELEQIVAKDSEAVDQMETNVDSVAIDIQQQGEENKSQNLKESMEPITALEETDGKDKISPLTLESTKPSVNNEVTIAKTNQDSEIDDGFDNLLQPNNTESLIVEEEVLPENNKIILNLDTNTTTTMKRELNDSTCNDSKQSKSLQESTKTCKDDLKPLSYNSNSSFIPISNKSETLHSDLSNDIFASLQVPSNSQNPESISPTAAFLMAFPLVSSLSGKTEVLDEEIKEEFKYQSQTPPMLLQIGAIEPNSFKIKSSAANDISENNSKNDNQEDKSSDEVKSLSKAIEKESTKEPLKISTIIHQLTSASPTLSDVVNSFPENSRNSTSDNNTANNSVSMINESLICQVSAATNEKSLNYVSAKNDILTISPDSLTPNKNVIPMKYDDSQYLKSHNEIESKKNPHYDFHSEIPTSTTDAFNPQENNVSFINPDNKNVTFPNTTNESERICPEVKLQEISSTSSSPSSSSLASLSSMCQKEKIDVNLQNNSTPEQMHSKIPERIQLNVLDSHNIREYDSFNTILSSNCPSKIIQTNNSIQIENASTSVVESNSQNINNPTSHHDCHKTVEAFTVTNTQLPFETPTIYPTTSKQSTNLNKLEQKNEIFSTKKVETNELSQNIYDKNKLNDKKPQSNDSESSIRNTYQGKSEESISYIVPPFGKSEKKMATSTEILNDKNIILNSYSQQQFIATSNYEENTISKTQATTTVAQNSSNFSIVSWTTFSPATGNNNNNNNPSNNSNNNNNLVQFDQGNDAIQSKTIGENFNYLPINKESFPNTLPITSTYSSDPQSSGFDKSRNKQSPEMPKRSYLDNTKTRNVRSIPTLQKQNRSHQTQHQNHSQNRSQNQNPPQNLPQNNAQNQTHTQNQNHSQNHSQTQNPNHTQNTIANEYKFVNDGKNKIKYTELDYMQNDYSGIDSRQQQHALKISTQLAPTKQQDKNYIMPDYGMQTHFDTDPQQMRYNIEVYANSNFKYDKTQQHQQKYQSSSQVNILQQENANYNPANKQTQQQQQQTSVKSKTQLQQIQQQNTARPPVNWMMTPEIKHNSNITDIILPPIGKDLDFCQNNLFSQTPSYNQSTSNQFYNNYDVTTHGFPNISVLQTDPKRMDANFYPEEQPFSWSPTKNITQNDPTQTIKPIDHQIVPSTLPTLVGDLALGTNLPEKQNFLFGQMPIRSSNNEQKDQAKEKRLSEDQREFQMINTNVQHTSQGMSFLSVSQLVEHEKEKNLHQQQQQLPQQQQQQQHQQTRKHQRKSNTSPRNSAKRQLELRKQSVHELQREEHKSTFDQSYQQQGKYQQNDIHWRSRNCKSNYTAEALISTNTSVNETSDKNSAKYTNYSQNKFPTDPMMSINYFSNVDDASGYGQVVNQNFNHSYGYTSNTNIYPTSNFITSISNTPTNYMMPLHENSDYLEANNFLLQPPTTSNITTPTLANKNHQHIPASKHQNCTDKRLYPSTQKKGKRKNDGVQNFELPLSGITSPLDEYHHTTHFLPPHANPLYQNHPQANVYPKPMNALAPPPPPLPPAPPSSASLPPAIPSGNGIPSTSGISSSNPMTVGHHPSGTSLINFNLSTIFPEMNDKNCYKSSANEIQPGLVQSSTHAPTSYPQRSSYTNSLVHMSQVPETMQFTSDVPPPPPPPPLSGVVHYKNP